MHLKQKRKVVHTTQKTINATKIVHHLKFRCRPRGRRRRGGRREVRRIHKTGSPGCLPAGRALREEWNGRRNENVLNNHHKQDMSLFLLVS